jgi:hypothetical protein
MIRGYFDAEYLIGAIPDEAVSTMMTAPENGSTPPVSFANLQNTMSA